MGKVSNTNSQSIDEMMRSGSQNWHRAGQSDSGSPKVLGSDSQSIEDMMRSGSQNWHRAGQSDSSSPKVLNTDSQTIEEMVNSGKLTPLTSLQQLVDILPKADMWPQMISERENLTDSSEEIMRSGSQNWHRAGQSDSSFPKVLNIDSQ